MEVILRETIDKLGTAGSVVTVQPGFARNHLLPKKLAYLATPGNLKVIAQERYRMERQQAQERQEAEKLRDSLGEVSLSFSRRVGEHDVLYGSVTSSDIAEALEGKGVIVDRRKILMDDHIKKLGDFVVPVRLFPEMLGEIKVRVEAENVDASPEPEPVAAAEPETPEDS